jgi:hypothetical protein
MSKAASTGAKIVTIYTGDTVVAVQKDEIGTARPTKFKIGNAQINMEPPCKQMALPECDDPHATMSTAVSL